ncbi:MAG: hypothetical protein QGG40_22495, partial [Myxococcota bacterium]|nr:hypothetical protein [Myxococcota bacterium]
ELVFFLQASFTNTCEYSPLLEIDIPSATLTVDGDSEAWLNMDLEQVSIGTEWGGVVNAGETENIEFSPNESIRDLDDWPCGEQVDARFVLVNEYGQVNVTLEPVTFECSD